MEIEPESYKNEDFLDDPRLSKFLKEVMFHPDWGKKEISRAKREAEEAKIPDYSTPLAQLQKTWVSLQKAWHTFQMQHDSRYEKAFHQTLKRIEGAKPQIRSRPTGISLARIAIHDLGDRPPIRMSRMKLDALPELKMELERVRIQTLLGQAAKLEKLADEKSEAALLLKDYLEVRSFYDKENQTLQKAKENYRKVKAAYQKKKDKAMQKKVLHQGAKITEGEEHLRSFKQKMDQSQEMLRFNPLLATLAEQELTEKMVNRWEKELQLAKKELKTVQTQLNV